MMHALIQFLLWFFVWLLLTWPPSVNDVISGVIVSIFVSVMTIDVFNTAYSRGNGNGRPKKSLSGFIFRLSWFVCYLFVFLWECIKANVDVAFRVLHPDLPIRPATIKAKTSLKSEIGLTFLANSLTLTPGRTTIDIDKDKGYIYLHILNLKHGKEDHLTVLGRYENILRRIFE